MTAKMLAAVKEYMRVETDEDDTLITTLYNAAEQYLGNAGVWKTAENSALYMLALHGLTLHYYDHRDSEGDETAFPSALRPVLNQLKLTAGISAESASVP